VERPEGEGDLGLTDRPPERIDDVCGPSHGCRGVVVGESELHPGPRQEVGRSDLRGALGADDAGRDEGQRRVETFRLVQLGGRAGHVARAHPQPDELHLREQLEDRVRVGRRRRELLQPGAGLVAVVDLARHDRVGQHEREACRLVAAGHHARAGVVGHTRSPEWMPRERQSDRACALEEPPTRRVGEAGRPGLADRGLPVVPPLVQCDAAGDDPPAEPVDRLLARAGITLAQRAPGLLRGSSPVGLQPVTDRGEGLQAGGAALAAPGRRLGDGDGVQERPSTLR
jgi:hypothetical protein